MIQTLETLLRSGWSDMLPGRPTPHRIRTALLATSREAHGTRILLLFSDHDRAPSMVGKVPRNPARCETLEREWHLLTLLHEDMSEGLLGTLPRPLKRMEVHGAPVFLQTALPGVNLKTQLQRRERPLSGEQAHLDLQQMDGWLELFQRLPLPGPAAQTSEDEPDPVALATAALPPATSLHQPLSEVMQTLVAEAVVTQAQGEALLEAAIRLEEANAGRSCWVHGDLWPGNVLVQGERWYVLDWDGLMLGLPWQDKVWFALHYGMLCHAQLIGREDLGEGLRRTLFMHHPISEAVTGYLRRIVSGGGLGETGARDYLTVLLGIEAGRVLNGTSRRRAFDVNAPTILREWVSYPDQVRL